MVRLLLLLLCGGYDYPPGGLRAVAVRQGKPLQPTARTTGLSLPPVSRRLGASTTRRRGPFTPRQAPCSIRRADLHSRGRSASGRAPHRSQRVLGCGPGGHLPRLELIDARDTTPPPAQLFHLPATCELRQRELTRACYAGISSVTGLGSVARASETGTDGKAMTI